MLNISFDPFPVLETRRLVLRRIEKEDLKDFMSLRSSEDVMLKMDKEPFVLEQEIVDFMDRIERSLQHNSGITWAIALKQDPRLIGTIGFHNIYREHHRAEIGYALLPIFHKQGIMSEAAKAAIDFGFNKLGFHSIEARLNPLNKASKAVLEKFNFVKEGHLKESHYFREVFHDTAIYTLFNR